MKKKQQQVKVNFRRLDPKTVPIPPALFLTPREWTNRWQTKMQQAIQMAR